MTPAYSTFTTPIGEFSVAVDANNALLATAFGGTAALRQRFAAADLVRDAWRTHDVREQIAAYFAGNLRAFTLPLAPAGTPFQESVWRALAEIPFGETRSYGQLAAALGRPHAARAVGRANATNPICLIVPCHRVIGADGSLTGFAFGEEIKRRLLAHERDSALRTRAA